MHLTLYVILEDSLGKDFMGQGRVLQDLEQGPDPASWRPDKGKDSPEPLCLCIPIPCWPRHQIASRSLSVEEEERQGVWLIHKAISLFGHVN